MITMNKIRAYTFTELMIVIAVVLILSAAAITGSREIIKNMKFSNVFNRVVFMVQSARNSALTEKNSAAIYSVKFDIAESESKISIFSDTAQIESFTILMADNLKLFINKSDALPCSSSAELIYSSTSASLSLKCDGGGISPSLNIGIKEAAEGGKSKFFIIHKAAGIPQVQ